MRLGPSLLRFVWRPDELPAPPESGGVALIDLAFAHGERFDQVTAPFLTRLGARLVAWIDHHDHPAWSRYTGDVRFVLASKLVARACPELVTPELVRRLGPVEHVWAHADFDGCIAAAKFLRGGEAPYPEADEDARAADAPGQGFVMSARGERLTRALDRVRSVGTEAACVGLLEEIAAALVGGSEPPELVERTTLLRDAQRGHEAELVTLIDKATRPHPEVLLLVLGRPLPSPDKKLLLRVMEERATVAMMSDGAWTTVATFADHGDDGLALNEIPGLSGQRGYAWGRLKPEVTLRYVAEQLRGLRKG